jgi:hypothetical protein
LAQTALYWQPLLSLLESLLEPYLTYEMAPTRLVSDCPDEDMGEDDRGVKKHKNLPRSGKRLPVIEDFLDVLSSASESVIQLNKRENEANRRGVHKINMNRLKKALDGLPVVEDVSALDAKLNEIDSYLADVQALCVDYIGDMAAEGDLDDIIWSIKKARGQLLGTCCYWMSRCGKAGCYTPRH